MRRLLLPKVEADLEGDGYLLRLPGGGYEMLVRQGTERDEPRRRFTLAHEMGHFMLERLEATKDETSHLLKLDVKEVPQAEVETWCNRFASALLLPDKAVHAVMKGPTGLLDAPRINAAARKCQVSLDAFCYRSAYLFGAALAILGPDLTVRHISPTFLNTDENRRIVHAALTQQVADGKVEERVIGGRLAPITGERKVIFGLKAF